MAIVGREKIHKCARAKFPGEATRGELLEISRTRYFARPAIAIAKIGDYSQSTPTLKWRTVFHYLDNILRF